MYSTYILVHPKTQQLQKVLTLEDYQQIQALLEYVLKRQQQQYLQHVEDQNREHLRLCQALYNNKLLLMDYRRQRAAQLQRILQRHHEQLHDCDRARLLAALEKYRAQQVFRRFIETYYQQNDQEYGVKSDMSASSNSTQQEFVQQKLRTPIAYNNATQQEPAQTKVEAFDSDSPDIIQQESTNPEEQQMEEKDEEPIDNAYEQYQTQQLEDLLKHVFEKNTKGQHSGTENDDEEEEYAYAPVQAQENLQDEQTMADLLPLLNEKDDNVRDKYLDPAPKKTVSPPAASTKASEPTAETDDDKPFLPDNVLPLQDVLDELIRTPTPVVHSSTKKDAPSPSRTPAPSTKKAPPPAKASATVKPAAPSQPTKDPSPPPVPPKSTSSESKNHPDRQKKLDQLSVIERKLDELSKENQDGHITHLPLQHQVNDQGRLILDGNTPNNRKFLTYEDEIIRCMIQLDQILSDGDTMVRDRRREVVRKAESLLEPVDRHKQDEWTRAQQTGKKKHRHRHHKRKARIPVTA